MRDIHSIGQAFKIVSGGTAKGEVDSEGSNLSEVSVRDTKPIASQESSPQKMKCHKCKTEHIQQSKEDWWLCSCGSYHKGFPYKCPIKQAREEMLKEIPCPQMSMESIFNCSCCWCKSLKETWLGEGKE